MRIQNKMKVDGVNTVVFNLHQIKRQAVFLGHLVYVLEYEQGSTSKHNRAQSNKIREK